MEPKALVAAQMRLANVPIVGEPINAGEDATSFIVHVLGKRDGAGRQTPTQKSLVEAKAIFAAQGIHVQFVIVDTQLENIEQTIRTSLLSSFDEFVRNAFLSKEGVSYSIWLELKRVLSDSERIELDRFIQQFGALNRFDINKVRFLSEEQIATPFETLSALRKIAPASCDQLFQELTARKFSVPSLDWVNRRFDALRKAGLVTRLEGRRYAVTLEGLHRLGTQKNRSSADVTRLLALARRQV